MITRKEFLKGSVIAGGAVMAAGISLEAKEEKKVSAEEVIKSRTGKSLSEIKTDKKVVLEVPTIAESGANVPVKASVAAPVEDVVSLHIFVDNNPTPHILGAKFSPLSGEAYLEARVRFAKSSVIRCVALMKSGEAIMATQNVKVTVGGCG